MIQDDLFAKSGGNFPYRRYIKGTSDNISRLEFLINKYTPMYDSNGFNRSKINHAVVSRFRNNTSVFDFFEPGPKNISQDIDWNLNSVIDQYTETSRMSSPGYGKQHTPIELWFKTSFSTLRDKLMKNKKSLTEAREAIYSAGEVRLAYVTDCIGLYNYVKTQLLANIKYPKVIDITAFGDRLTAACATGFEYIGIDPDPGLVDGISRLTLDLKTINPDFKAITYTIPLEHFTSESKVDFISLSPPPYSAEPYTGGDRQVHKVYTDFRHWFYGFIREALTRASFWLNEEGILAFSVLDRNYPHKIVYTEAMILLAMSLGFRPIKIFTLSSDSGTPWWIFQKDSTFSSDMFLTMYPELLIPDISKNVSPAIEYIRYLASNYVTEICKNHRVFVNPKKTKDILGRIMMSKIPNPNEPDPLFPDDTSDIQIDESELNNIDDLIMPIVIQTSDAGYRNIVTRSKSTKETLLQIFNTVISYLHWIQCTVEFDLFEKNLKVGNNGTNGTNVNLYIERKDQISSISFIRKHTLFTQETLDSIKVFPKFISLWNSSDYGINEKNVSSYIRYESVGVFGHHFTRTMSRINSIAKITGVNSNDIVDLFATPSNANSKLYTSVYPDVDPGSLGNFYVYNGGNHKVLMANPPPYLEILDRLINVYLNEDTIIFYSTTVWEDNGMKYLNMIKNNEDPMFDDIVNYNLLTRLWKEFKSLVKGVYILDHGSHPTFDMAKNNVTMTKTRATESVGVILCRKEINLDNLTLLSNDKHVIF